eukprot:TRINITY_DN10007_c0_g1_i1.p1 TRINITY_DN10007_c0_g1~~TRINITY_DN10007_c0_g1_i1.p1  ORF type:complete len:795 (+),score=259.23 TRINITY_DN10007_c0_g1_i1:59-2386(+)
MAGVRTAQTKSVGYAPQVERIPLLPGNNFHDDPINRATLRKSHGLGMNSVQPDFVPPTEYSVSKNPADAAPRRQPTREEMLKQWAPQTHVYRFLAFFREAVSESADESHRVRRCCINFFTEDGTIMIREGRVANSGAANSVHGGGAVLVKRHRVYEADGTAVDLEDLQVGEEFECYGKVFKVLDCDAFTRRELTAKGWVIPEGLPWPEQEDVHAALNKRRMKMEGIRKLRTQDMDVKRQMEFALSGRCSKVHPEQARAAQQFLAAGGGGGVSHLTFRMLWDDRSGVRRECRVMALRYYLEDDTVEIAENRVVNSGRDSAVKFMCRQRLQKAGVPPPDIHTGEVQHGTFGCLLRRDYVTHKDLSIGDTITVHRKDFLIFDADEHTRQWYQKQGSPLSPPLDVSTILKEAGGAEQPVRHYPPPHDGYGDEEDSLGNWRSLMLKAPKKDYDKLLRDGHKVLRFRATQENRAPEEEGREFVLNYFLATNEVEVIENSVRNSGVIAGKFLSKRKLYREIPETGQKVVLDDSFFRAGNVVPVLGRHFRLHEIDARSQKFLGGVNDPPTPERVREIIGALRDLLNQKYQKTTEAFRAISSKGVIGVSDIRHFLEINNQPVGRREAKTVLSYFDIRGEGQLDFNAFVNMMEYKNSQNMDESSSQTRSFKVEHVLLDEEDEHEAADRSIQRKYQERKLKRALRDRLEQRCMKQQEVFRLMAGQNSSSLLDQREFSWGLRNILHMQLTAEEHKVLVESLFPEGKREVTFPEFSTFLEAVGEFLPV